MHLFSGGGIGIVFVVIIIVFLLVALYVGLLIGLGIPIWTIIDCVKSPKLSTTKKIGWIFGTVFFWSIGACLYGAFVSDNRKLRRYSRAGGILIILSLVVRPFVQNYIVREKGQEDVQILARFDQARLIGITENERSEIRTEWNQLHQEADGRWYQHSKEKERLENFRRLLKELVEDGQLDRPKYDDWTRFFRAREGLGPDFQQYLIHLSLGNLNKKFSGLTGATKPTSSNTRP